MAITQKDSNWLNTKVVEEFSKRKSLNSHQDIPSKKLRQRQIELLHAFLIGAWENVLEPATKLEDNWHLVLLAEHLELVASGATKKLLINIAPRSLKSILVSVCYPCWEWLHNPGERFLCLSYDSELANSHNDDRRSIIKSDWYQELAFQALGSPLRLSGTRDRISEFMNDRRGVMMARGLTGAVTGAGGTRLIIDDGNNPIDENPDVIKLASKRFKDYSFGRRNDPKRTAIIAIQQRLSIMDISGMIEKDLNVNNDWTIVKLPTRHKSERSLEIKSPKDGRIIHVREPQSLLHPTRHGEKEDTEALLTLGAHMYAGRHDQQPIPEGGGIFPDAFKYFSVESLPMRRQLAISVDASFGEVHEKASFVVVQFWAIARPNFYLVDQHREKMTFDQTLKAIFDIRKKWEPTVGFIPLTLIEKKANGKAIIDNLRTKFPGIVSINPKESKKARAEAIAPVFRSGNVALNDNSLWVPEYELELANFPVAENNDQVDASSQLIAYFLNLWMREDQHDEGYSHTYNSSSW